MKQGSPGSNSRYRPELQGLRAVAALLVVVYHIWFNRVSGGVDVFFVLSGFFITGGLMRQIENNGHIDFGAYLVRLIKRLLPAALLVILAVLIACLAWLPRVRWEETASELLAAALYFENWQLSRTAVDYLAEDAAASPVQHYWALSVQGQFYLLWPALFGIVGWLAFGNRSRRTMFVVLSLVALLSLGYSVYATAENQPAAYFNTFTRIWQFGLGGMLALVLPQSGMHENLRGITGWAGLIAIISCGMVFQVGAVFPGYAALWPSLAAAMIIAAGSSGKWWGADRLLASRPMAGLGNISYSLYLWHWPVLVFFLALTDRSEVRTGQGLMLILFSMALAWTSTRLIENPIRFSTIGNSRYRRGYALGVACLLPVLLATGVWIAYIEKHSRLLEAWWIDNPDYPGAAALFDEMLGTNADTGVPIQPGPIAARRDVPAIYRDGCHQTPRKAQLIVCDYGRENGDRTIALVGGSHSAHWLPALVRASESSGWRVISMTKSACRFTALFDFYHADPSCAKWNLAVMDKLLELKPDLVFTLATVYGGAEEQMPEGYVNHWRVLDQAGIRVLAVRDTPRMDINVPECVERYGPEASRCRRPRHELYLPGDPFADMEGHFDNVFFLDGVDAFCDREFCSPVVGNLLVYRDEHHITATYARSLGPFIDKEISRVFSERPFEFE